MDALRGHPSSPCLSYAVAAVAPLAPPCRGIPAPGDVAPAFSQPQMSIDCVDECGTLALRSLNGLGV